MNTPAALSQQWADAFGLALVPLFETKEVDATGSHFVLLDGGHGSFAMSATEDSIWQSQSPSCWAWSSNLPHHVTVTNRSVAVTRWDISKAEVFSRFSVEERIDDFYNYLATDRVQSGQRVVYYVLDVFRRIRSLVAAASLPDAQSTEAFLAFLAEMIERDRYEASSHDRSALLNAQVSTKILRELPENGVNALIEELTDTKSSRQPFRLFPSLAVRHAGSEIFQEAHFELLRAPSLDLFSYAEPAEAKLVTRGGAHFTPAALARSVVEQTLLQVEDLASRERLIVLDPACGSGSFLHETLRALRRLQFVGKIVLVGRDISHAAVSMANFVVRHGAADWASKSAIKIDISVGDSLTDPLPEADVILMNPPFISWPLLSDRQREQMQRILGGGIQGRGDISMVFISRAIDTLTVGGVLGVLLPASLLTLDAAKRWRSGLLERADLRLLASFGDYGLFAYALVQVAVAVMCKSVAPRGLTTAMVATDSADATGNALRNLRRSNGRTPKPGRNKEWRLFEVQTDVLRVRPTWRLVTPVAETALSRLMDAGAMRVFELFDVRQGVHTGNNSAFVIGLSDYETLPTQEKRYFRPAVMNRSIQDGRLQARYWVFYPYESAGPCFSSEAALLEAVPRYAERFLVPQREALRHRPLRGANWWELAERRATWAFRSIPRLVSKYFGGPGGFAADIAAEYLPVQGYVWFPKFAQHTDATEDDMTELTVDDLLCAYLGIMNSQRFGDVIEVFAPHVAGGQFNLSARYVRHIPIPNLSYLSGDERLGRLVHRLVELGRDPHRNEPAWIASSDEITYELYGGGDFFNLV